MMMMNLMVGNAIQSLIKNGKQVIQLNTCLLQNPPVHQQNHPCLRENLRRLQRIVPKHPQKYYHHHYQQDNHGTQILQQPINKFKQGATSTCCVYVDES